MFTLYKQLTTKYPYCVFGYIDNGTSMQLSVVSKRYKKNNVKMKMVELDKDMQFYANEFMEMIREIHSDQTSQRV